MTMDFKLYETTYWEAIKSPIVSGLLTAESGVFAILTLIVGIFTIYYFKRNKVQFVLVSILFLTFSFIFAQMTLLSIERQDMDRLVHGLRLNNSLDKLMVQEQNRDFDIESVQERKSQAVAETNLTKLTKNIQGLRKSIAPTRIFLLKMSDGKIIEGELSIHLSDKDFSYLETDSIHINPKGSKTKYGAMLQGMPVAQKIYLTKEDYQKYLESPL